MSRFEIIRLLLFVLTFMAVVFAAFLIFRQETAEIDDKLPDTESWYTYNNEQYGFEIRYPAELEALEGKTRLFNPATLSTRLSVCFAQTLRRKEYCEFELYLAGDRLDNLMTKELFVGGTRCPKDMPFIPRFGRIQGREVDTCRNGKLIYRSAVAISRHGVLIFSTEPSAGHTIGKNETFETMIRTFRFIQ